MKAITTIAGLALGIAFGPSSALGNEGLKLSPTLSRVPVPVVTPAPSAPMPAAGPTRSLVASAPPMFVPPDGSRQYRIGEEDLLDIKVFGVDQLTSTVRVNPRGQVTLPLIGPVTVGGLTSQEAEATIAARLAESYLQNPQVSVFIKEFTTQRVTVEGAVNRPGVYPLRGQATLLTSLALAGGPARMSETTQVMVFRADRGGRRVGTTYDVDRIRTGEIEDPAIYNDDLIVVNRTASRVFLRDSVFGDLLDVLNPFRWAPAP
jgi:polysaccharide export outer membrane protein